MRPSIAAIVFKTKDILYASDGAHGPCGAHRRNQLRASNLATRLVDKGIISFKDNTIDADVNNITNSTLLLSNSC